MKKDNKQIYKLRSTKVDEMLDDSKHRLEYGIESVNHLYGLYHGPQGKKEKGAPLQIKQDILRAMVVIAGAALDATIKGIVKSCYYELVTHEEDVRSEAAKMIHRDVLKKLDDHGEMLAGAMLSKDLKEGLIDLVIEDITGESLQSTSKLIEVAKKLCVDKQIQINKRELNEAFIARNQIIHEMDLETSAKKKWDRRRRNKKDMAKYAEAMLNIADDFIQKVDARLKACKAKH
ncbi:MAG: hypothetical protein WC956_00600 [bacterium]